MKKLLVVAVAMILLFAFVAAKPAGYESLWHKMIYSRGMLLYFAGLVVLAVLPFLNKYLKTVGIYFAVFALMRGIYRITDEQDLVRMTWSVPEGLKIGLFVAAPLVLMLAVWKGLEMLLGRAAVISHLSEVEILDYINKARQKGLGEAGLRDMLAKEGMSEAEIKQIVDRFLAGKK